MGIIKDTKGKYLTWEKDRQIYEAINSDDDKCGYLILDKIGRHYHWIWHQESGIGMSPGCLDEVRRKQKELYKDRKQK